MRIAKIKTSTRAFFHHYLTITYPHHKIRKGERTILAELLYWRYEISKNVSKDSIIDKLVLDAETKAKVSKNLGLNMNDIHQGISVLRNRYKAIKGKRFNKKYIPDLKHDAKEFSVVYKFILDDKEKSPNQSEVNQEDKKDSQ